MRRWIDCAPPNPPADPKLTEAERRLLASLAGGSADDAIRDAHRAIAEAAALRQARVDAVADSEPVYVDWCSDCGCGLVEGDYHACQLPYIGADEET
jgi:hypothetical protein